MKILIEEDSKFICCDSDEPTIGSYYILEDCATGTTAQNSLFHSLITEYFKSGMHSYKASSFKEFKKVIKVHLGEGFEKYKYATVHKLNGKWKPLFHEVKKKEDIPEEVLADPDYRDFVQGILKSWSDYTLKQRKKCIDNVITEMLQAGVNTKKFDEILKGIDYGG